MVEGPHHRRVTLEDGCATTVHVVAFPLASRRPEVVRLEPEAPLEVWCAERGIADAVSGGYAVKPEHELLGEAWTGGRPRPHRPFAAPWDQRRAAIVLDDGVQIDRRDRLPGRPDGDLLQAGPLLVRDGRSAIAGLEDPEGFSATAHEFDQDLTASREPRLAIARRDDTVLVAAADGRGDDDAGLTLWELADVLVDLGATSAMNLDAGSAGVIVCGGRRVNTPRDDEGNAMERSSPSVTAIVFR
jgi:hypothetical protein